MTTQPLFNPLNFVKIIANNKPLTAAIITYALKQTFGAYKATKKGYKFLQA